MEEETVIEKNIKQFVFSKINEHVYLDISKYNIITIKHRSKQGSIALGMFWLRVFRHQNNYPMPKYPYKELYDKQGNNKVILKVDSVTLTFYLTTGTLMIQGNHVLDWFLRHFQFIMDNYDAPVKQLSDTEAFKQYTESWKKLEDIYSLKTAEEDQIQKALEDRALEILTEKGNMALENITEDANGTQNATEETNGTQNATEETNGTVTNDNTNTNAVVVDADEAVDDLTEEIELMSIDRWPASTVEEQLTKLRTGCVKDGSTYIYKLWKSLLHHWFSDPDCKVYLVTPFLDASRLADICQIILQHKLEADLEAFYVRQQCDRERRIHEVKQDALKQFRDAKDQLFIEYKIFKNIIYPMKRFHAKFMAGVKDGVAHVIITSANFHGDHFDCSNMETIQYQTMNEARFLQGYLGPIISSLTELK